MLRKTLTAAALTGALILSPLAAAPALAAPDGEDVAKVLLGLAAVGVIANALENERDRDRAAAARARQEALTPTHYDGYRDGHDRWRRHLPPLPARCEIEVRTRRGWTDAFAKRCLQREGIRVNRLPEACEFRVRTQQGNRTFYGSRCLRHHGYTVEAGRRHWRP